jgi:hypothetical protein
MGVIEKGINESAGGTTAPPTAPFRSHQQRKYLLGLRSGVPLLFRELRLFALDSLVNLFTVDRHVSRRVDTNTHLVTFDPENGHGHIVTDHEGLTNPTG